MGEVVTSENYIPADGETTSETARNIANLLASENEDGSEDSGEKAPQEAQTQTPEQTGNPTQVTRQRDENGKFVKNGTTQLPKNPQPVQQDPALQPPARLSAEDKKLFMQAPDNMKRALNKMFRDGEADYTRKNQALAESMKRSEGIINTAEQYITNSNLADAQGRRYTPDRLFTELLQAHTNIARDPERYLAQMIQQTNADPEKIGMFLQGKDPSGS